MARGEGGERGVVFEDPSTTMLGFIVGGASPCTPMEEVEELGCGSCWLVVDPPEDEYRTIFADRGDDLVLVGVASRSACDRSSHVPTTRMAQPEKTWVSNVTHEHINNKNARLVRSWIPRYQRPVLYFLHETPTPELGT